MGLGLVFGARDGGSALRTEPEKPAHTVGTWPHTSSAASASSPSEKRLLRAGRGLGVASSSAPTRPSNGSAPKPAAAASAARLAALAAPSAPTAVASKARA